MNEQKIKFLEDKRVYLRPIQQEILTSFILEPFGIKKEESSLEHKLSLVGKEFKTGLSEYPTMIQDLI